MAMTKRLVQLLMMIILVLPLATSKRILASDPDILADYILSQNSKTVDATFFTYTRLRGILIKSMKPLRRREQAWWSSRHSMARVCRTRCYNSLRAHFPPHTRPDATGLLFLLDGSLEVGLIDTKNVLYTQKLQAGDMFVFPKGLIHYQCNTDPQYPATTIAAFGNASARAVAVPPTVLVSGTDDVILAKSFKTDVDTIKKIKACLATS